MKHSAKFIVVEGLEGAGKSTVIAFIKHWLVEKGIPDSQIITTREPGGTPIAEKLREIVKTCHENPVYQQEKLVSTTELLFMYAARTQLVYNVIKPALAKNIWVIGDRHELSTRAYQGGGRGIPQGSLKALHQLCLGDFKADLTLYLDILPSVGLERIKIRGFKDRIEQESLLFFERVREVYLSYVKNDKTIFLIDAGHSMEQVHESVGTILEKYVT